MTSTTVVPRPAAPVGWIRDQVARESHRKPYQAFKTDASRAVFLNAYDAALGLWPSPYETREIEGAFGTTHVVMRGSADAPPLVLLHGMRMGAPMWFPNAGAWSAHHRLYAIDIIGDSNRSLAKAPLGSAGAYVAWFDETLAALGLDTVNLGGLSYGGWLALNAALELPGRVRRLMLFDPAASFALLRPAFFLRCLPLLIHPTRLFATAYLRWFLRPGTAVPSEMMEMWVQGWKHFTISAAFPTVLSDERLRALHRPTLLLMGDQEVIYPSRDAALGRALRLIPDIQAEFVSGAAHVPTVEQPAWVNERVLRFLES